MHHNASVSDENRSEKQLHTISLLIAANSVSEAAEHAEVELYLASLERH